jgi:uncharacterized protein (TIGR00266 family)
MKHDILYQPSFAVARIMLDPGDSIRAESGAMVSMSPTVSLEAKVPGGIGKAIGRLFGGESIFQTTFTATHGPGEVLLAPSTVGDITALDVSGGGFMVTSGSYLAGDTSLEFETRASFRGLLVGEGLFLMRISGYGLLLLSTFGAIHSIELRLGESYVVDSGHIVAFTDTMEYRARRATRSLFGSLTSGEGIVAHFTGPGILYMQTRSPQSFGAYLGQFLPTKGS